jgi:hypothetical protein
VQVQQDQRRLVPPGQAVGLAALGAADHPHVASAGEDALDQLQAGGVVLHTQHGRRCLVIGWRGLGHLRPLWVNCIAAGVLPGALAGNVGSTGQQLDQLRRCRSEPRRRSASGLSMAIEISPGLDPAGTLSGQSEGGLPDLLVPAVGLLLGRDLLGWDRRRDHGGLQRDEA